MEFVRGLTSCPLSRPPAPLPNLHAGSRQIAVAPHRYRNGLCKPLHLVITDGGLWREACLLTFVSNCFPLYEVVATPVAEAEYRIPKPREATRSGIGVSRICDIRPHIGVNMPYKVYYHPHLPLAKVLQAIVVPKGRDPVWASGWKIAQIGKSTRLNSSHDCISYAVFCLKKKKL